MFGFLGLVLDTVLTPVTVVVDAAEVIGEAIAETAEFVVDVVSGDFMNDE